MGKIIINLIFMLVSIGQTGYSQMVTGMVKDKANVPVSYATVTLYALPDTTYISGTITDTEGRFKLKTVENQQLLLQASCIGYKTCHLPALPDQTIILEEEVVLMGEVVVKGTRPISKLTQNGVQTTIANTILSEIGTGNEVLKRIPMVSGDNGQFNIFGRGKARIYINNREVRDPSELDNLNSSAIQSVEVITDPGARYDATVAAVINIKTIKKRGDGFSFNARSSFNTWKNTDYINQINTNYRKGGLDVFEVQSLPML